MSNRVDFFQGQRRALALAAGRVAVFVEGRLCGQLEPVRIVRAGPPEFGSATFRHNGDASVQVEQIERLFPMGSRVRVEAVYEYPSPHGAAAGYPIFVGRIERIDTRIDATDESVEITARDYSAVLERITVFGRRIEQDGEGVFVSGPATVFNRDGLADASVEPVASGGGTYRVFCAEPGRGRSWKYAEVIEYLLNEYLPRGRIGRPGIERLRALTDDRSVRDLDVSGMSLLRALEKCCEPVGVKFRFVPRQSESGPAEAIVFYRDAATRTVELNLQRRGRRLSVSQTNVGKLRSQRLMWPVTKRYIGRGGFKVYESTFELVGCWDAALEDTDYEKYSPATNPQFHQVRNVWRKWGLNESGYYSRDPCNIAEPYDFSRVFEGEPYVRRRRRFLPCLSTDELGKSVGYYLEVSYDSGQSWSQYPYAFDNLLDECAIWLSSEQIDSDTWAAAIAGTLRFRMTASIQSDSRLTCVVADGPVKSTAPVVDEIIELSSRFAYRKVSPMSILAGEASAGSNQVDDSEAMHEYVRTMAETQRRIIETFDVSTLTLEIDYEPGDRVVSSADSRDLFATARDNRSVCFIERAVIDFAKQCTELRVIRRRC